MYDLVGKRNLWFAISAILTLPGLLFILLGGLRPSIDFTGGTEWEVRYASEPSAAEVRDFLLAAGYEEVTVTQLGDGYLRIRTEPIDLAPPPTPVPATPSPSASADASAAATESATASVSAGASADASASPSAESRPGSTMPWRSTPALQAAGCTSATNCSIRGRSASRPGGRRRRCPTSAGVSCQLRCDRCVGKG